VPIPLIEAVKQEDGPAVPFVSFSFEYGIAKFAVAPELEIRTRQSFERLMMTACLFRESKPMLFADIAGRTGENVARV
jgi:hypothetical protein